jgi:hypothetical protein
MKTTPTLQSYAVGTAAEGMPASGGESILAASPIGAAAAFVLGGDWPDTMDSITVSVAPIRAGEIQRSEAQSVTFPAADLDLEAVESEGTWTVRDHAGGRWWPGDGARAEIADAGDGGSLTALAICVAEPARGEWRS